MSDMSPSQFQSLEVDWNSISDALSKDEAAIAEAMSYFRITGDETPLIAATASRRQHQDRMRQLILRMCNAI